MAEGVAGLIVSDVVCDSAKWPLHDKNYLCSCVTGNIFQSWTLNAIYLFAKYADGQMLGKSDMQSYCTSTSNSQHSTQVVECFPSEQVSLAEFLDDQSDDGYATSPAASSPGSMWSASASPSTIDEDTITSIASLWDDMSNDSLFRSSGKRRADQSSTEEKPSKFLKVMESCSSLEGPQSAQVPKGYGDFTSALKHSQLLLHLAGTPADDHLITVPEASKCPEQSKMKRYSVFLHVECFGQQLVLLIKCELWDSIVMQIILMHYVNT